MGVPSFVACHSHLIVDYVFLSRQSTTVSPPNRVATNDVVMLFTVEEIMFQCIKP